MTAYVDIRNAAGIKYWIDQVIQLLSAILRWR